MEYAVKQADAAGESLKDDVVDTTQGRNDEGRDGTNGNLENRSCELLNCGCVGQTYRLLRGRGEEDSTAGPTSNKRQAPV